MAPRHVYLVRHAKAEPDRGSGDAARALTREGRQRFRALVKELRPRLEVVRILTSPYVRARETAELLAEATGAAIDEDEALASGASDGQAVLDLARRAGPGVALVGHNPEFAEAFALAAQREHRIRPGTVAAFRTPALSLAWVESPPAGD